jgi:hypothetical protein
MKGRLGLDRGLETRIGMKSKKKNGTYSHRSQVASYSHE